MVLKIGIQHGLVPYDIASMYIRRDSSPDAPCALEKLVQECVEKLHVLELLQKMGKTQENVLSRSLSTRLVDEAEESEESEEEKAERKRSGSISQRNLSFQSMASIGYSKEPYRFPEVGMEREREKVMGRMWSLSWCTIRSIDRCFL